MKHEPSFRPLLTSTAILKAAATFHGMSVQQMLFRRQDRRRVAARHDAILAMVERTELTHQQIADLIGKDRCSVTHYANKESTSTYLPGIMAAAETLDGVWGNPDGGMGG